MKSIISQAIIIAVLLFSSCSQEDMDTFSEVDIKGEINNLPENYEATLKGYEITYEKDESTPSTTSETSASKAFMDLLTDSLDNTYTKTKVTKGAVSFTQGYVWKKR